MNNFDALLSVIKEQGGNSGIIEGKDCFDRVSKLTKIPVERLIHYLDTLEAVGLIKYNSHQDCIKLTEYGKIKESAFS